MKDKSHSINFKDITGQRFGLLVVLSVVKTTYSGGALWLCQCDCGKQREVLGTVLRANRVISCGHSVNRNRKVWE
jgi:hypothetical protein